MTIHSFQVAMVVASAAVGLAAAVLWWLSSLVKIAPAGNEPGEDAAKQLYWTGATLDALRRAADLNKWAALLSGISIFLGVGGSVSPGFFPGPPG